MNIMIILFVIISSICASIVRKKIYKKILSLSMGANATLVLIAVLGKTNNQLDFEVFGLISYIIINCLLAIAAVCAHLVKRSTPNG